MRICFVTEGCYPYVAGGVSSWMHSMIKAFPKVEFVILTIITDRSSSGKFVYELPPNVTEVHEAYLNDSDWSPKRRYFNIPSKAVHALESLVLNKDVDWETVFDYVQRERPSINDLLMGKEFYNIVKTYYDNEFSEITFTDFLWTMRSVYLPLFQVLLTDVPKADIYHCVATGYAGILGCLASRIHGGQLMLSEHGIYTREREEELIQAEWLQGFYKNIWIDHFKKMSQAVYDRAAVVTSLFEHARELQEDLGCPREKQVITPNGIDVTRFENIPQKDENEKYVDIGAFVRVTPIKDIKTLIQAFFTAKQAVPNLRLWIMGPDDEDEEYAAECHQYADHLGLKDVIFTGRINTTEYIGRMDFTILTSISEGQPLVILESYAARKPAIATDVGNCKGLLYGEGDDDLGHAGILTHVMNHRELTAAMIELATHKQMAQKMGEIGYQRLKIKYTIGHMQGMYQSIYKNLAEREGVKWPE